MSRDHPATIVLVAYPTVARLYVVRGGDVEEVLGGGFPIRRSVLPSERNEPAAELAFLWRVDAAVRAAVPPEGSLLLAGDPEVVRRLHGLVGGARRVDGVEPDATPTTPGVEPPPAAMLQRARRAGTLTRTIP